MSPGWDLRFRIEREWDNDCVEESVDMMMMYVFLCRRRRVELKIGKANQNADFNK